MGHTYTNSATQGRGGSFKGRKPTGRVGLLSRAGAEQAADGATGGWSVGRAGVHVLFNWLQTTWLTGQFALRSTHVCVYLRICPSISISRSIHPSIHPSTYRSYPDLFDLI